MKTLLASLVVLLSLNLGAQISIQPLISSETDKNIVNFTGIISERYANGKPSLWKEVDNGQASGKWMEWYPNGNLRYRAFWKDGKGHGKWEYFYENGNLRSVSTYDMDITIGLYRSFHPNGVLAGEETFVAGKRHGISYQYDTQGKEIASQLFLDGDVALDKPILFEPGNISTKNNNEWDITFTPDGKELYFTRREEGKSQQQVFKSRKENGRWSESKPAFASADDGSAFITSDGSRMYSESFRPMPGRSRIQETDSNIWYREMRDGSWTSPIALPENINKLMSENDKWPANYESGPTTDPTGNLYFWSKSKSGNNSSIYIAKVKNDGSFEDPSELPEPINSEGWDVTSTISPDGKYMIISTSGRNGTFGNEDLYYAKKTIDGWSIPKNLGPEINTSRYEASPRFSPDGKYFFFTSDRGEELNTDGDRIWNIYYMEAKYLLVE